MIPHHRPPESSLHSNGYEVSTLSLPSNRKGSAIPRGETMELARAELSRIVGYQNPYSWSVDSNETVSGQHKYYFLDRDGVNEHGDTCLHRLLALHASPAVVTNFLTLLKEHWHIWNQHVENGSSLGRFSGLPAPCRIDQANKKGVTALHVTIYRNSWHVDEVAKELIKCCPQLTSMKMSPCGSYPLHVACGHSITIREEVLIVLLEADGQVAWKEDCEGDNPLSLLWKNVLRFRWARRWEEEDIVPVAFKGDLSWMTVIAPSQYLDYSLAILEGAYGRTHLDWNDACGFPRCPPLLIKMLLQEPTRLRGSLTTPSQDHKYPLHHAAGSLPVVYNNVHQMVINKAKSLVELILNATKGSSSNIRDQAGRFPLHYACHNKAAETLLILASAHPEALRALDPLTGMFPLQQVASRRDLQLQMDTIYRMMHLCPDVLAYVS